MPFPVIEVRRLSPASSFYAAITQPLGIRYLSSLPSLLPSLDSSSSPASASQASLQLAPLVFGPEDSQHPLFQVRQVAPNADLKTCHIVFSAPSADAVKAFHSAALKACPQLALSGTPAAATTNAVAALTNRGDAVSSRVSDPDGNTMEAVYRPSYSYTQPYSTGSSSIARRQRSDPTTPGRIITWSYTSPTASPSDRYADYADYADYAGDYDYMYESPSAYSGRYRSGGGGGTPSLRRSATSYDAGNPHTSKGVSTAGMIGVAAVGAAAGAALTYSMLSGGERTRSRSSRSRELEEPMAFSSFQRRSTYPDPYPVYTDSPPSYTSSRPRTSRKEIRELDDMYEDDRKSRSSRRHRSSSSRAHSEGPRSRLLLPEGDIRSRGLLTSGGGSTYVTARAAPALVSRHSAPAYELAGMTADRDSYVSASRSHRSSSTLRASGSGSPSSRHHRHSDRHPPNSSRSGSTRHGYSRSNSAGSGAYLTSARNVPLPASGAGSSHARWEEYDDDEGLAYHDEMENHFAPPEYEEFEFDDNDSIAPSDSISCVGSRNRSHRSYR